VWNTVLKSIENSKCTIHQWFKSTNVNATFFCIR
jgi:hypothetical protein